MCVYEKIRILGPGSLERALRPLESKKENQVFPFVSIVVPMRNSESTIERLMDRLLNFRFPKDRYEIIIVDDASSDHGAEIASRFLGDASPRTIVLRTKSVQGAASARNLGIRVAKGEIVAFTDSDCIPREDWLEQLTRTFADNAVAGTYGTVETDAAVLIDPVVGAPLGRFATCNASYRRSVLFDVDFFDEAFRDAFREDSDLAYRVQKAGWKVSFSKGAVVYHPVYIFRLRDFPKIVKRRKNDVLLYVKHSDFPQCKEDLGSALLMRPLIGPLSALSIYLSLGVVLILIFSSTAQYSLILLLGAASLSAGYFLLLKNAWNAASTNVKRSRVLFECFEKLFLSVVYFAAVELGRLWGTFKYRKILL